MSQTWVIKDTAPVDEASLTLATTNISFTTNNKKATSIGIVQDGSIVMLIYGGIGGVAQLDLGASSSFEWYNEAYRTLEFDTAPTGELLAWLQKNADKQVDTEYLTNTAELTAVANAIREKGGTSEQLACPDGFVAAIQAIQTGVPLQITVATNAGATVTATKGSKTVSGTADTSGNCTLTVDEAGTWTVTAATASTTKTSDVVVGINNVDLSLVDSVLNNNSWATIKKVSDAGQGENYWSIGDRKEVTLNGTVGHLTLSNYKTYAFIIGFNHNASVEGTNRIHFQLAKTALSGGKDVCFCDSKYNSQVSATGYFSMNSSYTNSGGWKNSQMRTHICGTSLSSYSDTIIAVIPAALRAVLKSVTKYTDNKGNQSTAASAVTATTDYFFLLSEFEVFGSISYGNTNEKNKQAQYAYYSAGNSKIKYKHNGTSTAAAWWLRSPVASSTEGFTSVRTSGTVNYPAARFSIGFTPGFCV